MLFDADSIRAVVSTLKSHFEKVEQPIPPLVCDPVCVSTSGHTLLKSDALEVLITELFPLTFLLTPNKAEAELILSSRGSEPSEIKNLEGMILAAENLLTLGPTNVLVKGGHLTVTREDVNRFRRSRPEVRIVSSRLYDENMEVLQISETLPANLDLVADVLHGIDGVTLYLRPRIDSTSTHGTGCTLSAALACEFSCAKSGTSPPCIVDIPRGCMCH